MPKVAIKRAQCELSSQIAKRVKATSITLNRLNRRQTERYSSSLENSRGAKEINSVKEAEMNSANIELFSNKIQTASYTQKNSFNSLNY